MIYYCRSFRVRKIIRLLICLINLIFLIRLIQLIVLPSGGRSTTCMIYNKKT